MNIYFREFDPKSPISTGTEWLAALTARNALVIFVYSVPYLDIGRRILLTARQAWVFCVILAAWFGLSIYPQTAGLANMINALLLAIGTLQLLDRAKEIGSALSDGLSLAYNAKTDDELQAAGKAIAPALSGSVVTAIELFISYGAFRAAEGLLARRFPIPDWFEEQFGKAQKKVQVEESGSKTSSNKPNQSQPSQEPAQTQSLSPKKVLEEPQQSRIAPEGANAPRSRVKTAARVVKGVAQFEGTRKTSEVASSFDLSTVGLLVGGGALALGLVGVVVLAGRRD